MAASAKVTDATPSADSTLAARAAFCGSRGQCGSASAMPTSRLQNGIRLVISCVKTSSQSAVVRATRRAEARADDDPDEMPGGVRRRR